MVWLACSSHDASIRPITNALGRAPGALRTATAAALAKAGAAYVDAAGHSAARMTVLATGAACLQAFLQINWTGPPLEQFSLADLLRPAVPSGHAFPSDEAVLRLLSVDSEETYTLTVAPWLLMAAKALLVDGRASSRPSCKVRALPAEAPHGLPADADIDWQSGLGRSCALGNPDGCLVGAAGGGRVAARPGQRCADCANGHVPSDYGQYVRRR